MTLSIIIPYYNANPWIGRMLDSLLDQELDPAEYEMIVVDDGSTEEPVVLMEYVRRFPQIHFFRKEHVGVSATRNFALSVARGDWIYLCDSDDFLQPKVLGRMIAVAESRDLEVLCARRIWLNPSAPIPVPHRNFEKVSDVQTGLEYLAAFPHTFSWGIWAYLFRHSAFKTHGISFKDKFSYVEDRLFLLALFPKVTRLATIDVDLYYYVQVDSSITHEKRRKNGTDFANAWLAVFERFSALIGDPSTPRPTADRLQQVGAEYALTLLKNVFRYCPVAETPAVMDRLSALGFYPAVKAKDGGMKRLINHRGIWVFLCRIYHVLPPQWR